MYVHVTGNFNKLHMSCIAEAVLNLCTLILVSICVEVNALTGEWYI